MKLVPTFDPSSEGILRSFGFQESKTLWENILLIIQLPFVPTDPFHSFTALNSKSFLIAQHFLIQMIGSKGLKNAIWTNG